MCLTRWFRAARADDDARGDTSARPRPAAPLLAFSTAPVPVRALRADSCGAQWHAALWSNATSADSRSESVFLDRVSSGVSLRESLGARWPCLDADARERLTASGTMRYHAPHLHNLWDAQRLLSLLILRGSATPLTNKSMVVSMAQEIDEGCCCRRAEPKRSLSIWERVCRVAELGRS